VRSFGDGGHNSKNNVVTFLGIALEFGPKKKKLK
jgi:hypothetical protein